MYIDDSGSASALSEETVSQIQTDDEATYDAIDQRDNIDISPNLDISNSDESEQIESEQTEEEAIPEVVTKLREELQQGYSCPKEQPNNPLPHCLMRTEEISLTHYIGWWKTNSTIQAYNYYTAFLTNETGSSILSLHNVRKLSESLVNFQVVMVDMCPMSCMAYTGRYADLTQCTH